MTEPAFRCVDLCVDYDGIRVVAGMTFDFPPTSLVSIIGPNGAGKTTFLNALAGQVVPSRGRVWLGGREITGLPVHRRTRMGLGRTFQISQLFHGLTVYENLRAAALAHFHRVQPFWVPVGRLADVRQSVERVIEEVRLGGIAHRPAEYLSHGEQRALEVGLALLSEPRILLMDEPLAGVGYREVEAAVDLVRRAAAGRTIILVEHNMDVVMNISDQILVMVRGELLTSGAPDAVKQDVRVRTAYLGGKA